MRMYLKVQYVEHLKSGEANNCNRRKMRIGRSLIVKCNS